MSWFDIYLDEKAHENRKSFHEWNEDQDKKNAEHDAMMQDLFLKMFEKNKKQNEAEFEADIRKAKEQAEAEIKASYIKQKKLPDERHKYFKDLLSG